MEPNIEQQLTELVSEQKKFHAKAEEEFKSFGTTSTATAEKLTAIQKQVDAIDLKLAERHVAAEPESSFEKELKENENIQRILRDKRGSAVMTLSGKSARELFERKTTITSSVGFTTATTGVLQIDRIPGITVEARQALKVRDLLTARPTQMQVIDFVKVLAPMTIASPQVEASAKAENALTFLSASERVKTIATWIPASRQIIDDFSELQGFIESTMPYYVNLAEEQQLLSGDGTGENLHGFIVQASVFNTALLSNVAGWNKIDVIGRAIQQITVAKELDPTFIVLHPNDFWSIRLQKDGFGRYILGDPQGPSLGGTGGMPGTPVRVTLFGLDVVSTTSIATGTFLVGTGSVIGSEIRDRMEMTVEISTEHASFFTQNLIAIRGEKRLALIVKRTGSFLSGSFSTSP